MLNFMLRNLFLVLIAAFSLSMYGCNDDTSTGGTPTVEGDYFPLTKGSTWTYKNADSTETMITVADDVTFNGKVYKWFSTNDSSDTGVRREGTTLFMLFPDSTGTGFTEVPILIETVGSMWTYKLTFFFTTTFSNKTVALLPTRVVRGTTYSSVLQVHSDITIEGFPVGSSSDTYYAKGVGMIEVVNSDDSENQQLMSHDIK
jgi:hypothetical protein